MNNNSVKRETGQPAGETEALAHTFSIVLAPSLLVLSSSLILQEVISGWEGEGQFLEKK